MPWSEVRAFLRANVVSLMKDPLLGESWLDGLYGDADGVRLAICLVIDLISHGIKAADVAEVLDSQDRGIAHSSKAFGRSVDTHPRQEKFACCSALTATRPPFAGVYVRVIDMWQFIDYYAGPTYYHTLGIRDRAVIRARFFADLATMRLGDIRVPWTGGRGRAWVMSLEEFLGMRDGLGADEAATLINDRLGLGKPAKVELLAVTYPKGYSIPCSQPTTFDADWSRAGGYYLSFRDLDGWGRTQPSSGSSHALSERVHGPSGSLADDFTVERIGEIKGLDENRAALLYEAYRRLPDLNSGVGTAVV